MQFYPFTLSVKVLCTSWFYFSMCVPNDDLYFCHDSVLRCVVSVVRHTQKTNKYFWERQTCAFWISWAVVQLCNFWEHLSILCRFVSIILCNDVRQFWRDVTVFSILISHRETLAFEYMTIVVTTTATAHTTTTANLNP